MATTNNVIDLDLTQFRRKRIRIDGDDNRILELNTSDLNVIVRLQEVYSKLTELAVTAGIDKLSTDTDEGMDELVTKLKEIDAKMREYIDYVFNSNVSEMCAADGSMYDPFNGQFRFELIIDKLFSLYDDNFSQEFKKMQKNVQKHTSKYVRK